MEHDAYALVVLGLVVGAVVGGAGRPPGSVGLLKDPLLLGLEDLGGRLGSVLLVQLVLSHRGL